MKDNNRHPIDELFQNKLNENQPVSEDSLWEEVEGIMDSRKKKRRFLIFMWTTLLLIGIATTGYFVLPNRDGKPKYAVTDPQKQISSQNIVGSATVSANSPGGGATETKESAGPVSNSTSSSTIVLTQSKNIINNNDILHTTFSVNNNTAGKASSSVSARNYSVAFKKHNTTVPNQQLVSSRVVGNERLNSAAPDKSIAANNANADAPNNDLRDNNNAINTNKYLSLKGNSTSPKDELVDTSTKKINVDLSEEQSKPKKPTHKSLLKWYVELDGAYMDNFHLVSAPTSASPYYDNIRGSDERPLATTNYMLKVGAVRKKVQFNFGFGITNIGEKIEYKNHNDSTGNLVIRNDSVFARNGSFINTYVTIPLQVTFLFPVKSVRFQLGFGTSASIPVKWTSYYISKNINELEDPKNLKVVNNIVLNVTLNAGLDVPFTRHWDGIVSLDFYRDVSNVFKSEYGVRQEYLGLGGYVGIRYTFSR